MRHPSSCSRGIGLVELMIAMTLGLIISATVIEVFVSQKESFRTQDELAHLQENARFAFEQIARDLRQVGNWGCVRDIDVTNATASTAWTDANDRAIVEQNGVLSLMFANPEVVATVGSGVDVSSVASPRLVSDCSKATMFDSSVVPAGYPDGSSIYTVSSVAYSVTNGALFRNTDNLIPSGVRGLSFRYGLAGGTGWAEQYQTAAGVGSAWGSVVSVQTTLQLSSDHIGTKTFQSVIALRNRLP